VPAACPLTLTVQAAADTVPIRDTGLIQDTGLIRDTVLI
jgi:hypothetical protein